MLENRSLYSRILPWVIGFLLTATILSSWLAAREAFKTASRTIQGALNAQIRFIEMKLPDDRLENRIDYLQDLCSRMRDFNECHVTVMRLNGDVLADSHTPAWQMMNQVYQPEMLLARSDPEGRGLSLRSDPDSGGNHYYLAGRIDRNGVPAGYIRVSVPAASPMSLFVTAGLAGLTVAIVGVLGLWFGITMMITRPIRRMELASRSQIEDIWRRWSGTGEDTRELAGLSRATAEMTGRLQDLLKAEIRQKRQLETMFRSMVDPVIVIDNQECLLRYNQAAISLFTTGGTDVSGRTILEVIRNTQLHRFVRKTLSRSVPQEEEIPFRNTEDRYYKAAGVAIEDGQGDIIGAMIVLNDVTRLRQLEKVRRDFVANVSHELKTPITAIRGFVETLLDSEMVGHENGVRFLKIILKQTDQIQAVIEDLLSLSRLEQDAMNGALKLEPVALEDVLKGAVATCETLASEHAIRLGTECDPGRIHCNRTLLQQAVVNLVDNAIKYGRDETDVVVRGLIDSGKVRISVIDQGPGIPPEHLQRIFERFYRLDKSRSRNLGGSGLGLAIVKHIAQAHRGHVDVRSEVGKGSIFTIEFPGDAGPVAG